MKLEPKKNEPHDEYQKQLITLEVKFKIIIILNGVQFYVSFLFCL